MTDEEINNLIDFTLESMIDKKTRYVIDKDNNHIVEKIMKMKNAYNSYVELREEIMEYVKTRLDRK